MDTQTIKWDYYPHVSAEGAARAFVERLVLNGKRPKVVGNLAAAKVDLKDFGVKPAPAGGGGGSPASSDGRVFPNDPLPFSGLTAVDAAGARS